MENKMCGGDALGVPLISEEKQGKHFEEVESNRGVDYSTGTTSFSKTCFNAINALSGVGLLSVPFALSSGGWLSLILLCVIANATFYTSLLIKRCMDFDPNIRTYPDIGDFAFGNTGRRIVSVFMNTELYIVVTGFLILEGDNLNNLFPDMSLEIGGLQISGKQGFVMFSALIILPSMWLSNLGFLSYVSATGVLASILILGSVLWVGAVDGVGFHEKGTPLNWKGIATAASLYSFCYCAHPVFPTLYTSMRNKNQFSQVLLLCFLLCTLCYALVAVLGYLMFGSSVKSQITLNLPTDKLSSKVGIYTTLAIPVSKYALTATPVVHAIEKYLLPYNNKRSFSLLIRAVLVVSTVVVALAVPFFGYLMSLVGAFLSAMASILLPCLCYLKISGAYRRFGLELVIIVGILLMGISIVIVGTYTSLVQIIGHL